MDIHDPEWKELDEFPAQNGWYDVAYLISGKYILGLMLFRDEEWLGFDGMRGRICKWREPMKMIDTKGYPIMNKDGAIELAAQIVEGICHNYKDSYRRLLRGDYRNEAEARLRVETIERQIQSAYFSRLSMSAADADSVISTLRRQVRKEEKWPT